MTNLCLDEGILQAYQDDELSPEMFEQVSTHLASCEVCAQVLSEIESEMELTVAAFAHEMSLSVPSERLRARLEQAIGELRPQPVLVKESAGTRARAWVASFVSSFNFSPQGAMSVAGVVVFFALAIVIGGYVIQQRDSETNYLAVSMNDKEQADLNFIGREMPDEIQPDKPEQNPLVKRRATPQRVNRKAIAASANASQLVAGNAQSNILQGEKTYLQAISLLTEAIEANGETSLKPTLLSDYKLNLAVVDQAINATQRTARTNPKSADAAEMLYAAYQSKLDLLSAVAEQSRPLIAER